MSSTRQTVSPTSNIQLIIDALADYAKITGIDLSENPLASALEQSNSPDSILQLLQGRETSFKEYRNGNRRLIGCLSPAVRVLQAFSGILGEVSHMYLLASRESLNVILSGSLPTSERVICWDRYSSYGTSLEYVFPSVTI